MALHPDYKDILAAFAANAVEYLVVGGYAVGFHGSPCFTKDLDLWVGSTADNLARVKRALVAFGAPEAVLSQLDDAAPEDVLWMGAPPTTTRALEQDQIVVTDDAYQDPVPIGRDSRRVRGLKIAAGNAFERSIRTWRPPPGPRSAVTPSSYCR